MSRVLHPTLGSLLAAAWALAGCSRAPHHEGDAPAPPALAPEVAVVAPAASSAPGGAAPAAPSLDELASIPEGACVREAPRHGAPRLRAPDPGGSPLPLIEDLLAKQARGAVDACLGRAPRLSGRLSMRIELPAAGGIAGATVVAGAGDETLHRCVTEALRATSMPSLSRGGTLVLDHFVLALCPDGTASWPTSQGWR